MELSSPAFGNGRAIPIRFTCDGAERSPPLTWQALPPGTRSLVLIVEDPDAPDPSHPRGIYTHWVLYNIPPELRSLEEAVAAAGLPAGARPGVNSANEPVYGGPCPPRGRHRYFHRLFALDTPLPDLGFPTREILLKRIQGHVLAEAELMATYERQERGPRH